MSKALTRTDFNFPGQKSVYHGKVRDVYNINDEKLVMVATDRISAFDVVLPEGIPYKGQMLNQIAAKFLDATTDICPNLSRTTPSLTATNESQPRSSSGSCRTMESFTGLTDRSASPMHPLSH